MENLLEETKDKLMNCQKMLKDVLWVGIDDGTEAITWDEFAKMADFNYDDDYGKINIRLDLVVVGKGWWMERHEYDGSEWWEFKEHPKLQSNHKKLTRIKTTPDEQHIYE
jgi:hypothetical protein